MRLPTIQLVRQQLTQPVVSDLPAVIRRSWFNSPVGKRIGKGQRIAVACGSRGIHKYRTIVLSTLDALRELGARPFIVAAMGSHGGATSEGQRALLASYGIDDSLGVPIVTDMEVEQIGTARLPVWWDKQALAADGVVLINRVKPHTDFRGRYESGLVKMAVVGLGKRTGADQMHALGTRRLRDFLVESFAVVRDHTPLLGGLAVLENANENTAHVEVLAVESFLEREPVLLEQSRRLMGRIPFDELDCLIIAECGKNYSGAGMDPNVIGRLQVEVSPELELKFAKPRITRIGLLDLAPESHGNATGIGLADLTTRRALAAINHEVSRINALVSRCLWRNKLPLACETDQELIALCLQTCWQPNLDEVRFAILPNTRETTDIWVSPRLAQQAASNPTLAVLGPVQPIPFDQDQRLNVRQLFPHAWCSRRHEPVDPE